jgi:hypothetical protein
MFCIHLVWTLECMDRLVGSAQSIYRLHHLLVVREYSLHILIVVTNDFFTKCLTIHLIQKIKIIIYFVMI